MAVATSLAIAGAVTAAASSGASFIQAGKQQRLQRQAEMEAEKAMAEARKKLDVNFYDQLAINKEPYELQREALLSQGAQAIAAGAESERGAAATAGRVMMAQNEAQAGVRTAMGNEMQALEKMSALEDSRLRDVNVQLDLEQVAGAQRAARDAQRQAAQATMQGINSASSAIGQGLALVPLYMKQNTPQVGGQKTFDGSPIQSSVPAQPSSIQVNSVSQAPDSSYLNQGTMASVNPDGQAFNGYNPYAIAQPNIQYQNYSPATNMPIRDGSLSGPGWNAAGLDYGLNAYDPFGFKPY